MRDKLKILAELTKIRITSFVTLTTAFGFICFAKEISYQILIPIVGVILVASGSAVINHLQEKDTDALMERTKNRPLPSKRITVNETVIIALVLISIGSFFLMFNGMLPFFLGLLNLVWYNLIYTPLKKISPIAIIPGSIVGAIPPAIGWTSAGGSIFDPQILIISFFFFIWQIPHFWLLLMVLGKDYENAGFPSLTKFFDINQLSRITFIWIIATVVTSLIIPLFGVVNHAALYFALLAAGIWLTWNAAKFLQNSNNKMNFRFAFREINIFVIIVMLIISLDQILIIY